MTTTTTTESGIAAQNTTADGRPETEREAKDRIAASGQTSTPDSERYKREAQALATHIGFVAKALDANSDESERPMIERAPIALRRMELLYAGENATKWPGELPIEARQSVADSPAMPDLWAALVTPSEDQLKNWMLEAGILGGTLKALTADHAQKESNQLAELGDKLDDRIVVRHVARMSEKDKRLCSPMHSTAQSFYLDRFDGADELSDMLAFQLIDLGEVLAETFIRSRFADKMANSTDWNIEIAEPCIDATIRQGYLAVDVWSRMQVVRAAR